MEWASNHYHARDSAGDSDRPGSALAATVAAGQLGRVDVPAIPRGIWSSERSQALATVRLRTQLYLAISSRPTWSRWTSSGPSASRRVRWWAYMLASLNTWLTPPAPCSCRQRSTTLELMFGTATLIMAICWRASLLPNLSIAHAALRTSRRAMSISMRMSATWALVTPISEMRWPKATRLLARLMAISSARSATPIARMQWWMRPG